MLRVETVIKQRVGPEENDKGSVSEGLEGGTYNTIGNGERLQKE